MHLYCFVCSHVPEAPLGGLSEALEHDVIIDTQNTQKTVTVCKQQKY